MANADELCQFARLGQIAKIQKCLQTHCVDVNALNLCGESALSTAIYHNQITTAEYLLANKADPKLRLSAGHTATHITCRLANISILHLVLSIKKDETNDEQQQQAKEDKHIYDCLRIKDNANLTPIHWAATQESVSKRQKIFAYLDQRMPGVLDSRYNINWFNSWAKARSWITEETLINTDQIHGQRSSLPLLNESRPVKIPSKTSLTNYQRTPIITITNVYDNTIDEQTTQISSKNEHTLQTPKLPLTPITSRIVAFTHRHISKQSPTTSATSQKTPYFQRLSSIVKNSLSPLADRSTYRIIENKHYDYEDTNISISSKRPSHNLLLNILPSTTTIQTLFEDEDNDNESNQLDYLCKSASTLSCSSPRAYISDV